MTCKLSAIVAVCDDWGIGCEGDMVVSNRADMRHFVACTKGCPVIMGRKTLLSFPGGRPQYRAYARYGLYTRGRRRGA